MARFCANCGSPLGVSDRVCGNCGTPAQDVPAGSQPARTQSVMANAENSRDIRKLAIIPIAVVAVIVFVVVASKLVGNVTGYKGTIRKMVKAMQDYDMAELESMASSISDEIYGSNGLNSYENMVTNVLDGYEDKVGTIDKISYEITDTSELSEIKLKQAKNILVDNYNIDVGNIKKIMHVEMILTVKGSEKSASYNVDELYLIKEGGKWKLLYGTL